MKDFADIPENYVNLVFQGTWRVTYRLVRTYESIANKFLVANNI